MFGLSASITPTASADDFDDDALQAHVETISDLGATRVHALLTVGEGDPIEAVSGTDTGGGGPVTEFYSIGSRAETFFAVVVLQLVDEGKLTLDDPVALHLPAIFEGSSDSATVTIRQLLQHTSGIPELPSPDDATAATPTPEDLILETIYTPLAFPSGTSWMYSNANYLLASVLIEELTGNSWESEIQTRILTPLGMEQTQPGTNAEYPDPLWSRADGGILTTPEDITHFLEALLDGTLLSPELTSDLLTKVATNRADESQFGLGLEWHPLSCGGGFWGNWSSIPGYKSIAGITEDGSRRVVVSNATITSDPATVTSQDDASRVLVDRALCNAN
jgi:D-alanyl-D-alanine carboxypeptidase